MQDFGYDDKYDKDKQGDKMQNVSTTSSESLNKLSTMSLKGHDTSHGSIIPLTVKQELSYLANEIIEKAETFGYEVVIETVPLQPLKMGNKKHKVTITPKNKR